MYLTFQAPERILQDVTKMTKDFLSGSPRNNAIIHVNHYNGDLKK